MMRLRNWRFTPGLWPSVVTLLVLPCLLSLGFWQLDRADQKRIMYQSFLQKQKAPELDINADNAAHANVETLLWRKIRARGEFEQQADILLDNQVLNREPGYFVLTPLRMPGENKRILVNRGWVPAAGDRSVLPETTPAVGEVEIHARATPVPATGILLKEDHSVESPRAGVYRVQRVDVAELSAVLGFELVPFVLRLEPESEHGYARVWALPGSDEARHLGYAFQWFALAFTLLAIYIVVNLKRITHD